MSCLKHKWFAVKSVRRYLGLHEVWFLVPIVVFGGVGMALGLSKTYVGLGFINLFLCALYTGIIFTAPDAPNSTSDPWNHMLSFCLPRAKDRICLKCNRTIFGAQKYLEKCARAEEKKAAEDAVREKLRQEARAIYEKRLEMFKRSRA